MEFEAVDEGVIGKILVAEGTDGVKVGTTIAVLLEEGETRGRRAQGRLRQQRRRQEQPKARACRSRRAPMPPPSSAQRRPTGSSPARGRPRQGMPARPPHRAAKNIELSALEGRGPGGRIVKADVEGARQAPLPRRRRRRRARRAQPSHAVSGRGRSRRSRTPPKSSATSARRSRAASPNRSRQVPHIYLTVDIRLDKLLKLAPSSTRHLRRAA